LYPIITKKKELTFSINQLVHEKLKYIFQSLDDSKEKIVIGIPNNYHNTHGEFKSYYYKNIKSSNKISVTKALQKITSSYNENIKISDIELLTDIIYQEQIISSKEIETEYSPKEKNPKTEELISKPKRPIKVAAPVVLFIESNE
jgi:hypothetical protein